MNSYEYSQKSPFSNNTTTSYNANNNHRSGGSSILTNMKVMI